MIYDMIVDVTKLNDPERKRIDFGGGDCESFGRPGEEPNPDRFQGGLLFEPRFEGPYARPLYGEYDLISLYPVSGLCPLCNSKNHKKIDQDIAHLPWRQVSERYECTMTVLYSHIARHMGPVYGKIAARHMANVPDAADFVSKVELREIDDAAFRISVDRLNYPDVGKPKRALKGEYGKLRPWTKERTLNEIAIREKEAVDYYDEMIKCKRDLERVFDEIMGNDFYTTDKRGEMLEAKRDYSSAISAKREVHSILTDLAKMSVIAARISAAPGNEGMLLSPEMDSMVSSILGKDYKQALQGIPHKSQEVEDEYFRVVESEQVPIL